MGIWHNITQAYAHESLVKDLKDIIQIQDIEPEVISLVISEDYSVDIIKCDFLNQFYSLMMDTELMRPENLIFSDDPLEGPIWNRISPLCDVNTCYWYYKTYLKLFTDPILHILCLLNIMDGRKSRLNAAIRCMEQANIDVGLLTETKLSTDMYTKSTMGYTVSATKAVGMSGGVALVHRQGKGWGLESIRSFGPNVIRATLVSGQRRWYIIGGYVSPNEQDVSTLACI